MTVMRSSVSMDQTFPFYSWEDSVLPDCKRTYLTLDGCQRHVNEIWGDLGINLEPPRVRDGRGSISARSETGVISMPRWSRNITVITHELAHNISGLIDPWGNVMHGGIFVHIYFTMLARYCDHKYHMLVNSARDYGLVVTPVKIKSRLQPYTFQECNELDTETDRRYG
jgi:hypothetical protein